MRFQVAIKGVPENIPKRLTKSNKIMLTDYLLSHNHLFFTNLSKRGTQTNKTLP